MALQQQFGTTTHPPPPELEPDQENGLPGYFRVREMWWRYEKDYGKEPTVVVDFKVEVLKDDKSRYADSIQIDGEFPKAFLEEEGPKAYSIELPADTPHSEFLEKAYEHLKTLDLFKDAEDC